METKIQRIIINHINAGNLELHGICVNELVKDIKSILPIGQNMVVNETIKELLEKYNVVIPFDEQVTIWLPDLLRMMDEYAENCILYDYKKENEQCYMFGEEETKELKKLFEEIKVKKDAINK